MYCPERATKQSRASLARMLSATVMQKQKHTNMNQSHFSLTIHSSINERNHLSSKHKHKVPRTHSEPHRIAPHRTVKLHVLETTCAIWCYVCICMCMCVLVRACIQGFSFCKQVGMGGNASKRPLLIQYFGLSWTFLFQRLYCTVEVRVCIRILILDLSL